MLSENIISNKRHSLWYSNNDVILIINDGDTLELRYVVGWIMSCKYTVEDNRNGSEIYPFLTVLNCKTSSCGVNIMST